MGIKRVSELKTSYPALWIRHIAPHIYGGAAYREPQEARTKSFSRETTFPSDITDMEMIKSHLSYLVDRLSVYLIDHKYYAGRIEVKVRFSDFSTFTKRMPLEFPTFSYHHLWQCAQHLLKILRTKKKLPLRLVGVKVEDIASRRDILPFVSLKNEHVSTGVTDIKNRFGFSSIFTGREMMLEKLYPVERDGIVLKTASLTK